ncbi:MAG TPA: DUF1302 domain-containing protein [Gammaproteobacteria bacterium]|nr:DUF1302 domain-containing protein [Gammaproteobacteria bacterium]
MLASALTAAGALFTLPAAQAAQFSVGQVTGSVDTTISLGASYRTEPRADSLIGKSNLYPTGHFAAMDAGYAPALGGTGANAALWEQYAYGPGSFGINSDDGDLNYPNHHWISQILKVGQSLSLRYQNVGMFVRGYYFYDFVNTNFRNRPLTDEYAYGQTYRPDSAERRIGHRGQLLDAYVYGTWNPGGHYLNVRVGNQVVNWGESTFMAFGLNRNNPVDVSAIHQPGTKVKDILLPVPMIHASMDITNSFSASAYWQWQWRKSYLDPSGSYFSGADPVGAGGQYVILGSGQYQDATALNPAVGAVVPHGTDKTNDNHNMFGLKLDYIFPNMTEVAFYAERNDMNVPIFNYITSNPTGTTPTGLYYLSYPKGIDTLGASFNTLVGNMSLAGEVSYTPDQPMQLDTVAMTNAELTPLSCPDPALNAACAAGGLPYPAGYLRSFITNQDVTPYAQLPANSVLKGYRRLHFWQADFTGTYLFGTGNWFNANSVIVLGEAGADYVPNLPPQSQVRFAAAGEYGKGGSTSQANGDVVSNAVAAPNSNFAGSFAWGYRALVQLDYEAWLGSQWAFKPTLFWSQDVNGTTPGPMANFVDGNKAASLHFIFDYQSAWEVSVGYNAFWGHRNYLRDRNYVDASVSYSF